MNLLLHLSATGHRADLLLRVAKGESLTELPPWVRVVELGRLPVRTLLRLVGSRRRERPRNVLARMSPQDEFAQFARRLAGTRVRTLVSVRSMLGGKDDIVVFRHRTLRHAHAAWGCFLASLRYPRSDGFVTVSGGAAWDVATLAHLPASRITVIPNPVICPRSLARASEPPTHPGFAAGPPPVILAVGRLDPRIWTCSSERTSRCELDEWQPIDREASTLDA